MTQNGFCKFCGGQGKLIRAHLIPESFYRPMLAQAGFACLITNTPGQYNRSLRTGVYDSELLCDPCERLSSPYDSYGKSLLLDTDWNILDQIPKRSPKAYVIPTYDYAKLKLFFMWVLWRVAASSRPEFGHVDLGPYLPRLRAALFAHDPGAVDDWSVAIARFKASSRFGGTLDARHCWLDPHRTRLKERKCVKIYLAEFIVWIKLEPNAFPSALRSICLDPNEPLFVIMRDFDTSPELRLMHKMSRKAVPAHSKLSVS